MAKAEPIPRFTQWQVIRLWKETTKGGCQVDLCDQEWFDDLGEAKRTFQHWRARYGFDSNLELMEHPPDKASRSLLTDGRSLGEQLGDQAAAVRAVADAHRMPGEAT